jgi:hypothetical protein
MDPKNINSSPQSVLSVDMPCTQLYKVPYAQVQHHAVGFKSLQPAVTDRCDGHAGHGKGMRLHSGYPSITDPQGCHRPTGTHPLPNTELPGSHSLFCLLCYRTTQQDN